MKTAIKDRVINILHRIYLKLFLIGERKVEKNRVYDNYGMIDTLGFDSDSNRFTYSYSDEFAYMFAIKLPFGYAIECVDGDGVKTIEIKKVTE